MLSTAAFSGTPLQLCPHGRLVRCAMALFLILCWPREGFLPWRGATVVSSALKGLGHHAPRPSHVLAVPRIGSPGAVLGKEGLFPATAIPPADVTAATQIPTVQCSPCGLQQQRMSQRSCAHFSSFIFSSFSSHTVDWNKA